MDWELVWWVFLGVCSLYRGVVVGVVGFIIGFCLPYGLELDYAAWYCREAECGEVDVF